MMDGAKGDFEKQLQNYRLTTAEIIYHIPDHPSLLQTYVWQDLDIAPKFPILNKFLHFWVAKLEGKLYRVTVANQTLINPNEFRYYGTEFTLQ